MNFEEIIKTFIKYFIKKIYVLKININLYSQKIALFDMDY